MSTIYRSAFTARAALVKGENPLPHFRSPEKDLDVRLKAAVPMAYHRLLGFDCGKRTLPYRIEDRYDRTRTETNIPAVVMENRFLKATFLPTLGGRLISLVDKIQERELLYANDGLQVGNLAILDAWFAGGIEWNIGQYGHTATTNKPLFTTIQQDGEGRQFLRMYEFERSKRLWWHLDFHLDDELPLLWVHAAVHNNEDEASSMYYWTNIAVRTSDELRVLASGRNAIYIDPYGPEKERLFGWMQAPSIEIYPGVDVSYPNRFAASNEYFFMCEADPLPWECALDGDGYGLYEVSTHPLSYRKMFCWGTHKGGRRWQRYLSPESDAEYVEIQSGLAPTQLHGTIIEGQQTLSWTQGFGALSVDPQRAHHHSYETARLSSEHAIRSIIDEHRLRSVHHRLSACRSAAAQQTLYNGSGWGYLETVACNRSLPPAFSFTADSVGAVEQPYLQLLEEGTLTPISDSALPLTPPPVGKPWRKRFTRALQDRTLTDEQRATLCHYLGILYLEEGEVSRAESCWLYTLQVVPNAFTARNLASLEVRRSKPSYALRWYRRAYLQPGFFLDVAIAEEYCRLLVQEHLFDEARTVFDALPPHWMGQSETLRIARAWVAAFDGDGALIKDLLFEEELGHVREGETPLDDLWLAYTLLTYTTENLANASAATIAMVQERYPLPDTFNWNMVR